MVRTPLSGIMSSGFYMRHDKGKQWLAVQATSPANCPWSSNSRCNLLPVKLLSLFNQILHANSQFLYRALASERCKNMGEDRMLINKQNLDSSTTCALQADARPPSQ